MQVVVDQCPGTSLRWGRVSLMRRPGHRVCMDAAKVPQKRPQFHSFRHRIHDAVYKSDELRNSLC
eukprot:972705-Amphidinium_carterae.1